MSTQAALSALSERRIEDAVRAAHPPRVLDESETRHYIGRIKRLLAEQDAVLVAHYYVDAELQRLAEETGGYVADSLEMARFGRDHPASTLVVAGVRFMGETAKILNPEKRVLMPELEAECSLDLGCPVDEFSAFCDAHPERTVVVYANTSAAVKARSDWVVTSGIALPIVAHLAQRGESILWAPDRHLGNYVRRETGVDMLLWPGSCVVHDRFRADAIRDLQARYPEAAVLVHPESPQDVVDLADVVGSTTALIKAAGTLQAHRLIVATERGIFYKMKQAAPEKILIEAPMFGVGATCESCARCPWMELNGLKGVADVLESGDNEIEIDEDTRVRALAPVQRMMEFAAQHNIGMKGKGNA